MNKYLKIAPADNVCVAIADLNEGDILNVDGFPVTIQNPIPTGHKFAIKEIKEDDDVIKYGYPIGHATVDIHTVNMCIT